MNIYVRNITRGLLVPITFGLIATAPPPAASAEPSSIRQRVDIRTASELVAKNRLKSPISSASPMARIEARSEFRRIRLSGYGSPSFSESVTVQDGSRSIISVPLSGASLVSGSNVTLVYDSGKLVDYYEVIYAAMDATSGRGIVWRNGAIVFDKVATDDGTVVDPSTPLNVKTFSLSKFNKCLANQGIAAWAVALAGVICGAGCAATFGMACALCFAGISFISGGVIALCLGKAQQ